MTNPASPRRRYDGSGRRHRAEVTRAKVVAAATTLFLERGYAGTTIPAIAEAAGVALQTVYRTAPGKAGLLAAAVRAAVAGGFGRSLRPVEERPAVKAVIDEPDPARQLAGYARTQPGIWARLGPLQRVLEGAALSDPELRDLRDELDRERHHGLTRFTASLHERGALRTSLTVERAADILVTVASLASYHSLVTTHGWPDAEYEAWLAATLQQCLLR